MTNEDYQLEELENAAVNKSNNAKRIAAAAGLAAVGGGAATYAATNIPVGSKEPVEVLLDEEDLDSVVKPGADQVHEPEPKPQPTPPTPHTPDDNDVDVSFDKTTHYYDDDHNLVATVEEGTIDGKQFKLVDVDGDMRADVAGFDADGNGVINEDEVVYLSGKDQIAMGHATAEHEDNFTAFHQPQPEPIDPYDPVPYDINYEKDYADNTIHNDFEDEKTGESYSHDYADNNDDYNNGDVYSAHSADGSDYAYEEDAKDEGDYGYNDLAENDTVEDSFEDIGSDSLV